MSEVHYKLSKKNYLICIPTRNRRFLMDERRGIWRYIDPMEGFEKYKFAIGQRSSEVEEGYNTPILAVPDRYDIAHKRNHFLEHSYNHNIEYLFIIDDDAIFYYRDESLSSKYTSKQEEFIKRDIFNKLLYETIQLCREEYPIVGLPLKQGSFGLKYMFPYNIPIIRFVCYHVPTLKKEDIKATGLGTTFMSDRYVQLSLLDKGYRSISHCGFCVGDPGTGYKGGCSDTRTVELQSEAAQLLQKRFPNHVELKWKEDGKWGERRLDCRISWKKFLPEGSEVYLPMEEGHKIIGEE